VRQIRPSKSAPAIGVELVRRSGGVAERRSLSGGVETALAEAVALAFEGDHGRVVDEPVDQGGGDAASELTTLLAPCRRPGLEWASSGCRSASRE
jgi:hypothetical protein